MHGESLLGAADWPIDSGTTGKSFYFLLVTWMECKHGWVHSDLNIKRQLLFTNKSLYIFLCKVN